MNLKLQIYSRLMAIFLIGANCYGMQPNSNNVKSNKIIVEVTPKSKANGSIVRNLKAYYYNNPETSLQLSIVYDSHDNVLDCLINHEELAKVHLKLWRAAIIHLEEIASAHMNPLIYSGYKKYEGTTEITIEEKEEMSSDLRAEEPRAAAAAAAAQNAPRQDQQKSK